MSINTSINTSSTPITPNEKLAQSFIKDNDYKILSGTVSSLNYILTDEIFSKNPSCLDLRNIWSLQD